MVSTKWGDKSNVFDLALVGGALLVAMAFLRRRSQQARGGAMPHNKTADARELALVKDIVYINNAVEPTQQFRFVRPPRADSGILVVGVCGGSGSGKTTLSRAIIDEFGADRVTYLSHDYYYKDLSHLTMAERAEHNFDHPDSLDTALLVEHVKQLRMGKTVQVPEYDFSTHSRCPQTREMKPNSVILIEGILIFADSPLSALMDIKVFVETAADIRLVRRMQRDMEERGRTASSVITQYMKTVRPMHMMFVEQSKRVADIIIPHGVNSVALDMILSRLYSFTQTTMSSTSSSADESEADGGVAAIAK